MPKELANCQSFRERLVGINELVLALKRMQKVPDDEKHKRIEEVLKALDIDKDGAIDIEHALKV